MKLQPGDYCECSSYEEVKSVMKVAKDCGYYAGGVLPSERFVYMYSSEQVYATVSHQRTKLTVPEFTKRLVYGAKKEECVQKVLGEWSPTLCWRYSQERTHTERHQRHRLVRNT